MRCVSVPTKAQKKFRNQASESRTRYILPKSVVTVRFLSAGFSLDACERLLLDERLVTKPIQPVNSRLFAKPGCLALGIMARLDSRGFESLLPAEAPFDYFESLLITDRFKRLRVTRNSSGQQRANLLDEAMLKDARRACVQPPIEQLARRRQSD